ncbi:uncharacterized protein LOC121504249 [Cheilinus undulatus]|uniref:uncharacterized protein LOC121504249 n=1 Tax=Cheilinus undulatus TaxID=241271 RepID=UPI001BD40B44|nr:uncharacterized protein LOC121504249 [Cheilinus undulatus]
MCHKVFYSSWCHFFQMGDYYRPRVENFKEVVVRSISPGSFLTRSSTNSVKYLSNSSDSGHLRARFPPFQVAEIKLRTEDTTVRSRRVGVNVEHEVILEIPNKPGYQEVYANDTEAVKKAVEDLIGCFEDCPSFNVTVEPTVTPTEQDHELACAQTVEDTAILQYFEPLDVNGMLACVTPCHPRHSTPKTCHNKGLCMVFKGTGPICYCLNSSSTWYLSDDCSLPIQKTALFVGLSVTLAVLLLLVGVLSAFALRNKYREKRSRDLNEEMVNRWLDADFEWFRSDLHRAEVYRNPYARDEATGYREEPDVNRQPSPAHQPTHPAPQNNFRQSARTSSPSQSAHGHITPPNMAGYSANQPMRIKRPQIRPSLDD